jgi:hypothetical protein
MSLTGARNTAEARAPIDTQVQALIAATSELDGKKLVTVPYEAAAFYTAKET